MEQRAIHETGEEFVRAWRRNARRLIRAGAYDPSDEHAACGVGFVAAVDGRPDRRVVEAGIDALRAVWHRGAVDADGMTGDGAGIQLQIPQAFFKQHVARTGHEPADRQLAVGMIFLPRTDHAAQETCRAIVETEIFAIGYHIYGWRQVPVDTAVIGEKANATRPEIEQIMIYSRDDLDETSESATSTCCAGGSSAKYSRPRSRTSTSARSAAAASSTRGCSWPSN